MKPLNPPFRERHSEDTSPPQGFWSRTAIHFHPDTIHRQNHMGAGDVQLSSHRLKLLFWFYAMFMNTYVCVYSWKLFTYMDMDMDLFKLTGSPNSIRKMFLPCLDLVFVCSTSFSYSLPQTSAFSSSALLASKVNLPHKEGCTGPQGLYSRTPI